MKSYHKTVHRRKESPEPSSKNLLFRDYEEGKAEKETEGQKPVSFGEHQVNVVFYGTEKKECDLRRQDLSIDQLLLQGEGFCSTNNLITNSINSQPYLL